MKILIIAVMLVLAVVLGGLAYLGFFSAVTVDERDMGPYQFVYVQEASTDSGTVKTLTQELGARLDQAGFKKRKPAQVYYPTGRGIQHQIGFMVDKAVPRQVLGMTTYFRPIDAQRFMVARFPYRNSLSYAIGNGRAEAAFAAHRAAKNYAETRTKVIRDGDSILYLQPIEPA